MKFGQVPLILLILMFLIVPTIYLTNATSYNDSVFTLNWTSVNNPLVFDVDQDGYADQIYSYSVSGQNYTFTKIFGNGTSSITLDIPTNFNFNSLTIDKERIYLGSGRVLLSDCYGSVGYANILNGSKSNTIAVDFFDDTLTPTYVFMHGMTGHNNEIISSFVCDGGPSNDYLGIKNNTHTIYNSTTDRVSFSNYGNQMFHTSLSPIFTNDYRFYADLNSPTNYIFTFGNCAGSIGCLVSFANQTISNSIKPSTPVISSVIADSNLYLFQNGLVLPRSQDGINGTSALWSSFLPSPDSSTENILVLLHYKLLDSTLSGEVIRGIFNNGTNKYVFYGALGSVLKYTELPVISDRAFGYYVSDASTDVFDSSLTTSTLPTNSYDFVSPTTTTTLTHSGLFSLLSGYEVQTASTVVRVMNTEVNNSTVIVPWVVGSSSSQIQLSMIIRNAPSSGAISIQDENNKLGSSYFKWSQDYIRADDTFDVDLPYPKCVDVYIRDLSLNNTNWEFLGNLCNTGVMPKTIVYSSNLSFTFWSLDYGVSHTFDQPTTGLTTMLRHDTYPYNYTVRIYDADNVLAYENEFQSLTELDNQSINATGIDLPALLRVYDDNGNQLYYATIGTPSYLSSDFAWFGEWFTIEGFNLLFMLPLIFGAMFTRNTVGVGTMITVAFIATLTWLGVIPVPDLVIYLMIFISIVGVIAYKKLYD